MDNINIKGTEILPKVKLNAKTGELEISGKSIPEDTEKFYLPIINWIKEYVKNPKKNTNVTFNLEYYNSSSLKRFIDILVNLKYLTENPNNVLDIKWIYEEDDEVSFENAQDLSNIVEIDIDYVPIKVAY